MMILIAGPYRSGTNDDPALIKKNVQEMESYALPIFRAGHIPILGEWLALPLVELAGSKKIGDEAFNEIFHPIAVRLLEKCDAVLRVGGVSAGADEMVRVGSSLGLKIYASLPKSRPPKPRRYRTVVLLTGTFSAYNFWCQYDTKVSRNANGTSSSPRALR